MGAAGAPVDAPTLAALLALVAPRFPAVAAAAVQRALMAGGALTSAAERLALTPAWPADLPARAPADALAALAQQCKAFVNLIPLHPGGAMGFTPTSRDGIHAFARRIKDRGVEVAIRKSRGTDISAACGQLRVERLTRRRPPEAE